MKSDLGNRVIAFIIDSIIVGIISSILTSVYGVIAGLPTSFWIGSELGTEDVWTIITFAGYYVIFAITKQGRTFGKLAMNLEVRYDDDREIPQDKLIVRELLKSVLMPVSFISFLFVVFREDNKSLHDLVMDTNVFDEVKETARPFEQREPIKPKERSDDPFDDYYE